MKTLGITAAAAGIALLAFGPSLVTPALAEDGAGRFEVSLLGGLQALNQNDTALPDNFINVPATAALTYHLNRIWAVEGEFSWMIPVKTTVDLGGTESLERKTPDMLTYQASVLAKLPMSDRPWTPYLAAGLGAITFLSSAEANRFPRLSESETAFAINFGAGASYGLGSVWALRADFREFAAFPPNDAAGLSSGNDSDPIWMERGTVGLSYRF